MNMIISGMLILGLSSLCSPLQGSQHKSQTAEETRETTKNVPAQAAAPVPPHNAPCFVDDILATLRESLEDNGQLRHNGPAQFAVCTDNYSMFAQRAAQANTHDEVMMSALHPTEVLVKMEEDEKTLTLTFDPSEAPPVMLTPVLLLSMENVIQTSGVNYTSPLLNPETQTSCASEKTKYLLLTVGEGSFPQAWKIRMSRTPADTEGDAVEGGDAGSAIGILALLLFSTPRGTDSSPPNISDLSHNSFLCELRRFLVQSFPQDQAAPVVSLDSLPSVSPQPIGLSSSESLLAGLVRSTAPTVLSFSRGSMLHAHHEMLALPPALLGELKQRLGHTLGTVQEVLKEDDLARGRLQRLLRLSGVPFSQQVEGKLQYRAFLLFKVLQTASHALSPPRGQRLTRDPSARAAPCGLTSLSVSLQRYLIAPGMAKIDNCQGSCSFPMIRASNHAVLLNSHIGDGNTNTRAPCCVPVAYNQLVVVKLEGTETSLEHEPNIVATECECR